MLANLGFPPAEIDVAINQHKTGRSIEQAPYAIANMPPAKECQSGVTLIGQFRSLTAISARPP